MRNYYRMINYALKELENYKSLMYSIFLYFLQALFSENMIFFFYEQIIK